MVVIQLVKVVQNVKIGRPYFVKMDMKVEKKDKIQNQIGTN